MLVNTREWGFESSEGRVAIRLRPPTGRGRRPSGELTAEVSAELRGCGSFRGACTVGLTAAELVRFHRQLDDLVAGREPRATLGGVGDQLGLTIDSERGGARMSGFLGGGLAGAVSFNDLELDGPSLARSNSVLGDVVRDLTRRPRWAVRIRRGPASG